MPRAYLSIGSNLGGRAENCIIAVARLAHKVQVLNVSDIYETEPWGKTDQPEFMNAAVEIETQLPPRELLAACKTIEDAMGRKPGERWGPRVIDLDILLYEDLIVEDENLILPHPHMHERRFVLQPLADIAPQVRHPVLRKTAAELLQDLGAEGGRVRKVGMDSATAGDEKEIPDD
jgi:2-amino-4-hydroxy-6-hydroxymethyldihydropteridine diphosphokinase